MLYKEYLAKWFAKPRHYHEDCFAVGSGYSTVNVYFLISHHLPHCPSSASSSVVSSSESHHGKTERRWDARKEHVETSVDRKGREAEGMAAGCIA